MPDLRLTALALPLLALSIGPALARTSDPNPWHVLKPTKCCFDDNTGTAAFVESYKTRQQCMAAALRLARKLSPPGCSVASCGAEVWCLNVDENAVNVSM